MHEAHNGFRYVNGTPADCVHIALTGLLGYRPDLVVSGINNGANMGDDTIYSGTVGAAMEGYLFGIPAIAFSQIEKGWAHLDAAAAQRTRTGAADRARSACSTAEPFLLNVNIPNRAAVDELKPFKVCRLGRRHAAEKVITQPSPHGETMYWIGGAGPRQGRRRRHRLPRHGARAHRRVTPLQIDLTDHASLPDWSAARPWRFAAVRDDAPPRLPGAHRAVRPHAAQPAQRAASGAPRPQRRGTARAGAGRRPRLRRGARAHGAADWRRRASPTPRVLRAMGTVERHRFVDSALVNQAYEDTSLPIGLGQTISKPSVVARMIELLLGGRAGAAGQLGRVLEIGTGCGYQAAVLAQVATEVYSIERLRGLHEKARDQPAPVPAAQRAPAASATACWASRRARPTRASSPRRAARRCRRPGSTSWRSAAASSRRP